MSANSIMVTAPDQATKEPTIAMAPAPGGVIKKSGSGFAAPFPSGYRASGVLLHVTSLPSPYGTGDLGPSAFAWVDQLAVAGQRWWQVLPLGPTGFGHSPYQALSSFAASTLIISPEKLVEHGLLKKRECDHVPFPSDIVDFAAVIPFKERILARAWKNFSDGARPDLRPEFEKFKEEKASLQADVALFMALRTKYHGRSFLEWPLDLVQRKPAALARATHELSQEIEKFLFGQFIVINQWLALKDHANHLGIQLLGDLPIFVSADSADVWSNPELFLLDAQHRPRVVAGVPPDYFSKQGQLWGNPLYDWDALRETRYDWWIKRLAARLEYLDAIRIDHFRAFEAAWHVPAGASTAQSGHWMAGPGADFFHEMRRTLGRLPLLAEDLGIITPPVEALRDQFQLPGMRVLQFGFNGDPNNPHLPHRCVHNGVVYTGTHDNDTTRGWYEALLESDRRHLWNYLRRTTGAANEVPHELIRLAWSSAAALAITPFQDLLGLGSGARMNMPGQREGQWRWRCLMNDTAIQNAFQWLYELTRTSGRLANQVISRPRRIS